MLLFGSIIFLGAFLLFAVQPVIAKLLLPWFGGSAVVWVTCMLFFQTALVLGYLVAYLGRRFLAPRAQAWTHALLLCGSLALLPITPGVGFRPTSGDAPTSQMLLVLLRFVGAPYVLLAASGPLFQSWFVDRYPGRNPYRLFALSNLASLLAVIAYPFAIEPRWSSPEQSRLWTFGYMGFVGLGVILALATPRGQRRPVAVSVDDDPPPSRSARFFWLALPACASALLLAITNHLTQDIAAMPLLWIVPLTLYLLSFIFCFEYSRAYRRIVFMPLLAIALAAMAYFRRPEAVHLGLWAHVIIYSAGLFVVSMVCHGEVARRKPAPQRLAGFYLVIACGGALGGIAVGLIAPLVLAYSAELEIGLVACAALAAAALIVNNGDAQNDERARRLFIFAGAYVFGLFIYVALALGDTLGDARLVVRNAYGSLREFDTTSPSGDVYRRLAHGRITHGAQWLTPARRREPTTYYCPTSGAGLALKEHHATEPRTVGVIGLGTGTLAAYAKPGDSWRFYDINPLVIEIAQRDFTFVADSGAHIDIVGGDARLSLERRRRKASMSSSSTRSPAMPFRCTCSPARPSRSISRTSNPMASSRSTSRTAISISCPSSPRRRRTFTKRRASSPPPIPTTRPTVLPPAGSSSPPTPTSFRAPPSRPCRRSCRPPAFAPGPTTTRACCRSSNEPRPRAPGRMIRA